MGHLQSDGSLILNSGKILWAGDPVRVGDLCELSQVLCRGQGLYAGNGGTGGFGGGGRGATGARGPQGAVGPQGPGGGGGEVTFPLLAPDGSAIAPSYSFVNDTGAGMFLVGAGELGFAAGGTQVFSAATSFGGPQLVAADGSAANPSYSFSTGTNSGWYFDGNPILAAAGIPLLEGSTSDPQVYLRQAGTQNLPSLGFSTSPDSGMFLVGVNPTFTAAGLEVVQFSNNGSAQILASSDGLAIAPSFSFVNDVTTGIFRGAGGELGLAAASTELLRLDGVGQQVLLGIDGTTSNPALSFIGDPNTGLYLPGVGILGFIVGVTEVGRFDATNMQFLHGNSGSAAFPSYSFTTDPTTGMFLDGSGDVGFTRSGTQTFTVTGAGATVTGKLTVTGVIDPTALILSGSTSLFLESEDGSAAPDSGGTTGRIRYNDSTGTWQISTQASAYSNILTAASAFPLLAPNGTAAAPVYSFSDGTDTGIFSIAGAGVGISSGGTEVARFAESGGGDPQILAASGVVGNPAYSFLNNNTTGLFLPLVNNLAFSTGGVERGRFDSTGALVINSEIGLNERVGDPASVANRGFLYTKDVAGVTQLFFERDDGTVLQIS